MLLSEIGDRIGWKLCENILKKQVPPQWMPFHIGEQGPHLSGGARKTLAPGTKTKINKKGRVNVVNRVLIHSTCIAKIKTKKPVAPKRLTHLF